MAHTELTQLKGIMTIMGTTGPMTITAQGLRAPPSGTCSTLPALFFNGLSIVLTFHVQEVHEYIDSEISFSNNKRRR